MGIKGLWTLIIPAGRRISIETLSGKRLAIDASIWITQFLKANRDPDTGQVRAAAHLIGFLRRICKLLFHGIFPVFVFDGATPEIKLRELNARRKRKLQWLGGLDDGGEQAVKKMARKLLVSQLRQSKELELSMSLARGDTKLHSTSGVALAPGFILSDELSGENSSESLIVSNSVPSMKQTRDGSMLMDRDVIVDMNDTSVEDDLEGEEEQLVLFPEENGEVNLDIQALAALPPKMRKEVIETAKRELRIKSRNEFMSVASDPMEYSNVQLKSFLKTVSLNKQIKNAAIQNQQDLPISVHSKGGKDKNTKSNTLFSSVTSDDSEIEFHWSERNDLRYNGTKPVGDRLQFNSMDYSECEEDQDGLFNNRSLLETSRPVEENYYDSIHQFVGEPTCISQPEFVSNVLEQSPGGGFTAIYEPETNCCDTDQGGGFVPMTAGPTIDPSIIRESNSVKHFNQPEAENVDEEIVNRSDIVDEKGIGTLCLSKDNLLENTRVLKTFHGLKEEETSYNNYPAPVDGPNNYIAHRTQGRDDKQYKNILPFQASQAKFLTSAHDIIASPLSEYVGDNAVIDTHNHISSGLLSSQLKSGEISQVKKLNDIKASDIFLDSQDDSDVDWEDGEAIQEEALDLNDKVSSVSITLQVGELDSSNKVLDLTENDYYDDLKESLRKQSCNPLCGEDNQELHSNKSAAARGVSSLLSVSQQSSSHIPESMGFDLSLEGLQRQEGELRDEWNKYMRDTDYATDEHIDEVKHLIQLFGLPIVQAPAEAEAQCAAMEKMGLVDGVVTEDSDALVFGAETVYKNIFDDKMFVEVYTGKELRKLGLSRNELVALAMLLGGDYTDGVKGVGIVNGMEVLQAFSMEQSVKEGLTKFRQWLESEKVSFPPGSAQESFHVKHLSARMRWSTPKDFPSPNVLHAYINPVVDQSELKLKWDPPDTTSLKIFCKRKIGWTEAETDYIIAPVIKQQTGPRQTTMDSYLMRYEDEIKFGQVRSARLRALWKDE